MINVKMWQSGKGFFKVDDRTVVFLTEEDMKREREKIRKVNTYPWDCPVCEKTFHGLTLEQRDAHVKECGAALEKKAETVMVSSLSKFLDQSGGSIVEELKAQIKALQEKLDKLEKKGKK